MPDSLPQRAATRGRPPWWFRLVRAILNLALLALLGLQVFTLLLLSTEKHLPLPAFVQTALEQRLQDQGLSVRFDSLEATLSGRLLLRGPHVSLVGTREPVAEADFLQIDPDWFTLFWDHRLAFSELLLVNASFYCPPEVSPTGVRESFLNDGDVAVAEEGNHWWRLEYLRTRFLNARILAQGDFIFSAPVPSVASPAATPTSAAPSPAGAPTLANQYRQFAAKVLARQKDLAAIENPVLYISLDGEKPNITKSKIVLYADGAQPAVPGLAPGFTMGRFWARASTAWDGRVLRAEAPVVARLQSIHFSQIAADNSIRDIFSGGPLWVRAQLADGPAGIFSQLPPNVTFRISPSTLYDFGFDSLGISWDLTQWPGLHVAAYAARDQSWLKLAGETNFDQQTVSLDYQAYIDPAIVFAAARSIEPPQLASLKFDSTPHLDGHFTLAPGYLPESLDFDLRTDGVHFDHFDLEALHAQGRLKTGGGDNSLDVPQLTLWNKTWRADGAAQLDFARQHFHLLAHGSIDPHVLDPYIRDQWWQDLWQHVLPGASWPSADVDYSGSWAPGTLPAFNPIFASIQLSGATVNSVLVDDARLRLYQRPDVVAVYDLDAQAHDGGRVTGAMIWIGKPPYKKLYEQHFIFDSTLPMVTAATVAGSDVLELVRPLDVPSPPSIQVDQRTGASENPQPGFVVTKLHVHSDSPFHAYHVPLDSVDADATLYYDAKRDNQFTDIPHLDFGIAGGRARAQATLTPVPQGQELAFSGLLLGSHHTGFFDDISKFSVEDATAATPAANPPAASAPILGDLSKPGQFDLSLGGRVFLGDKDSFAGKGHARIYDADLGRLPIFGWFSTKLSIANIKFDTAESDYQIAHQYIRFAPNPGPNPFPNLIISGSSAKITAAGLYNISNSKLDFNTEVSLFGNLQNSIFSKILNTVTEPITGGLPVSLGGTLENPSWSPRIDLMQAVRNQALISPPIPEYPHDSTNYPDLPIFPEPPELPARTIAPAKP